MTVFQLLSVVFLLMGAHVNGALCHGYGIRANVTDTPNLSQPALVAGSVHAQHLETLIAIHIRGGENLKQAGRYLTLRSKHLVTKMSISLRIPRSGTEYRSAIEFWLLCITPDVASRRFPPISIPVQFQVKVAVGSLILVV